jgi:hypothetical protein
MTPKSDTSNTDTAVNVNLVQNPPQANKMLWIIRGMVIFLTFIIIICWIFYAERYRFFNFTVSDLGAFFTHEHDYLNPTSRWIFTFGFLTLAAVILVLNIMYMKGTGFYAKKFKIGILIFFMLGAIGTACPFDSDKGMTGFFGEAFHIMHFIGAGLFVGGFGIYNLVCQLLRYIRKKKQGQYPKKEGVSWKRNRDFWVDLVFVYLVLAAIIWYLTSGILGIIIGPKTGILAILLPTAFSQKMVLIFAGIAGLFLLDPDDI